MDNSRGVNPISESEAVFTKRDLIRYKWYTEQTKKLDPYAGNRLFKVSDKGFTYWTQVRPKSVQDKLGKNGFTRGGVSTGEYILENFNTKFDYDNESSSSAWLHHLWQANPRITRNFKTVKFNIAKQANALSKKAMATIGNGVVRSDEYFGGSFRGRSGTWRF